MSEDYLDKFKREPLNRQRLLYGNWVAWEVSPSERLAMLYREACDAYDAQICTGHYEGEPIPATKEERLLIEDHARKTKWRLLNENPDVTSEQLHHAIMRGKGYR